jgi:hypothetical protein
MRMQHRAAGCQENAGNVAGPQTRIRRREVPKRRSWGSAETVPHRAQEGFAAEQTYHRALAVAQRQSAKPWELRAAAALPASGAIKANGPKPVIFSPRSTTGSPKVSTRRSCKTPRRCSPSSCDGAIERYDGVVSSAAASGGRLSSRTPARGAVARYASVVEGLFCDLPAPPLEPKSALTHQRSNLGRSGGCN